MWSGTGDGSLYKYLVWARIIMGGELGDDITAKSGNSEELLISGLLVSPIKLGI